MSANGWLADPQPKIEEPSRPNMATKKTDAELLGGKVAYLVANRMDDRGVRTANPLNRDVVQPPQRRLAIENRKKEITA